MVLTYHALDTAQKVIKNTHTYAYMCICVYTKTERERGMENSVQLGFEYPSKRSRILLEIIHLSCVYPTLKK